MLASQVPAKFPILWGSSAPGADIRPIPVPSQIAVQAGAASLTDGFPPLCFLALIAGGVPPFGQDFNGIFNQLTAWDQWLSAGGPIKWDSAFSSSIGGYPQGATVASATTFGAFWYSTADNNLTNPDAGGAGWVPYSLTGGATTGDMKPTIKTVADFGWVLMNDGTIGNASSNATTRANADTQPLFSALWNNVSNTFAPIFTSGGVPTTRGSTAAADYAANKQIQTLIALGRALCVAGAGAGLTVLALGGTIGENNHLLTIAEMPSHTHGTTDAGHNHQVKRSAIGVGGGAQISFMDGAGTDDGHFTDTATTGLTINSTGGGGSHNNMQPSFAANFMMKL